MSLDILFLVAAGLVVVSMAIWYITTMNRFAQLSVKINESESGVDVALTLRYDTLTKMVDATRAYARHEGDVLAQMVKLRKGMGMTERMEANHQMDELTGRINILAEAYPQLRASENFQQLQSAISEVENTLQAARRIYNMNVSSFNQMLVTWPDSIVGRQRGHASKMFFEADEQKRQDVSIAL